MEIEARPKLLTLGSLAWNTLLIPAEDDPTEFRRQAGWVGAPLLRAMIGQALVELEPDSNRTSEETQALVAQAVERIHKDILVAPPDSALEALRLDCVNITTVFRQASKTSSPRDSDSVLRVTTHYNSAAESPDQLEQSLSHYMKAAVAASNAPDVLVLFDFDSAYRAAAASSLPQLTPAVGKRITIVGLAGDLSDKSLARLTPETTGGPERTIAVVRAEELRKAGLVIVESGPIERTVRDVIPYFDHQPLKGIVERAKHLVILFEEVGAIHVRFDDREGWIHLSSNCDSIAHENGHKFGRAPGRMSITLAAIARQVYGAPSGAAVPDLSDAVRLGLAAFNRYFTEGYDRARPLHTLQSSVSYAVREQLKEFLEGRPGKKVRKEYVMSSLKFPVKKHALDTWTRLDEVVPADAQQLVKLQEIVLKGPEVAFRNIPKTLPGKWHPQARIQCPYMQVGDLKTFDEEEIAGFTSLTKLFRKYLQTPSWKSPLSIAVFGAPGTGKSFGVRELMKSINPAAEKELTFNLSQLRTTEALNDAFHDVQHRVLSSEEVPLVFFDEFDASFDGRLGWLKFFLAPMQDGVFRGKATDYRIGRAFFVFAGGTSPTFAKFKNQLNVEDAMKEDPDAKKLAQEAKVAKLPDFVSRLQGFLDIQSINPPEDGESDPPQKQLQRQIKRALLLRSLLLTYAKPIVRKQGEEQIPNIDEKLIGAFLNADRYEHGLRSMESVVRMSKWIDGRFIPASLPARSLLAMHVKGLRIQGLGGETTLS